MQVILPMQLIVTDPDYSVCTDVGSSMCNVLVLVLHRDKIISVSFMKKYIHIAKCMKPTLTEEASEAIAEEYSRLRSQDTVDTDVARVRVGEPSPF